MYKFPVLVIAFILFSCGSTAATAYPAVEVLNIGDGDTITVRENDSKKKT